MEPYATYGKFYDLTQSVPDGRVYRHLLDQHHPGADSLLEIGCGTGAQLVPLAEHYSVAGLDISRTMLRYARRKLPGVTFYRQNMAGFSVGRRFDAIISPYDSLNHLLKFGDWVRTFRAATRHLNAGGVFIFDVNTEYKLREMVAAPPWIHSVGGHHLIIDVTVSGTAVTDWDVKVFEPVRKGIYRLHHEIIKESFFHHDRVVTALRRYFNEVHAYDSNGWSRPKRTSRRLFYVCRKAANDTVQRMRGKAARR